MTTEQEKSQQEAVQESEQPIVEPEATSELTSELPGAEISPELTEPTAEVAQVEEKLDTKERLGVEVKTKLLACAEEDGCIDALLGRFEQVASKLGIPTEKLIEQVFSLLKGEKIES